MSQTTTPRWKTKRTAETRRVEEMLRKEFPNTDAYRYNSASIRVRIVDPRFEGKSVGQRDAMVEPHLEKLPAQTQMDIMNLTTLFPEEPRNSFKALLANEEFENPSKSDL